jgi:hypothetical protein
VEGAAAPAGPWRLVATGRGWRRWRPQSRAQYRNTALGCGRYRSESRDMPFASADLCAIAHSCADAATRSTRPSGCRAGSATNCEGDAVQSPGRPRVRRILRCPTRIGGLAAHSSSCGVREPVRGGFGASAPQRQAMNCCSQRPATAIHSLSIPQPRKTARTGRPEQAAALDADPHNAAASYCALGYGRSGVARRRAAATKGQAEAAMMRSAPSSSTTQRCASKSGRDQTFGEGTRLL